MLKNNFIYIIVLTLLVSAVPGICQDTAAGQGGYGQGYHAVSLPAMQNQYDDVSSSRHNAITRAVEMVSPAVVGINVTQLQRYYANNPYMDDPFFRHFFNDWPTMEKKVQSLGSGFIISSEGYILTNQHVVENALQIIVTLVGGKQLEAEVIGQDILSDLAVLKIIDDHPLPHVELGNSDDVIIGEWAIALGNPFGLFDISSRPTVTVGVISATDQDFGRQDKRVYEDMIQTDAAINGGNSGGPLVNCNGQVIGINAWIISGSESRSANIGLGFAIPINRVKRILNDLINYGHVDRTYWTGIQYDAVTPTIARYLGMREVRGAIISEVEKNSPAANAGLKIGDVILGINDTPVKRADDIRSIIDNLDLKAGDILKIEIFRDNRTFYMNVKLAPFRNKR